MADEPKKFGEGPLAQAPAQPPGQPPGQPPQFTVDTTAMSAAYANFCRVTGTPEELVLDFGLNTQMNPIPSAPVNPSRSCCRRARARAVTFRERAPDRGPR